MKLFIKCLFLYGLFACGTNTKYEPPVPVSHLKYFGFTLIDTYWDDPTDTQKKVNYADEVYSFNNLADMLVISPTDNINERVELFKEFEMKAVLHLHELFFELEDTNGPSGANYGLRKDYNARWNAFASINRSVLTASRIGSFYVGEEPTWNGISFEELNTVINLLYEEFPSIPTMVIEAAPALNDLQIPENTDWIGFDRYFIKDPNTNPNFQEKWQLLKSKRSDPSQKIMVIMDSHYIPSVHGSLGNISLQEMGEVADNYYGLAKQDEDVIGILGYFWPNGFDAPESIGARGMPQNVQDEYKRIGKEITGK